MKTNYNAIRNIFIQNSLSRLAIDIKLKKLNPTFIHTGEFEYLCWRFVFMKDISKKTLTNNFIAFGIDNLTIIEILDSLKAVRNSVKYILKEAKKEKK